VCLCAQCLAPVRQVAKTRFEELYDGPSLWKIGWFAYNKRLSKFENFSLAN